MSEGETKLCGSFPLDDGSELVFYAWYYKGVNYGGIRRYLCTDNYYGPTKAGIVMKKNILNDVLNSVKKANNLIRNSDATPGKIIDIVKKNNSTEIKLCFVESTSAIEDLSLDIREYAGSENYYGPTKKGFRIGCDLIPDLISNIQIVLTKLDKDNLK